jgi:hypothetical protein
LELDGPTQRGSHAPFLARALDAFEDLHLAAAAHFDLILRPASRRLHRLLQPRRRRRPDWLSDQTPKLRTELALSGTKAGVSELNQLLPETIAPKYPQP